MAKIIIDKDYFKNLSKGTHTLRVNFKDGYAEGQFEVDNKITFYILDETFTATKDMSWSEWITSYGVGVTGNGIVWVSDNRALYIDPRHKASWSYGYGVGNISELLFDTDANQQQLASIIVDGMQYGRDPRVPGKE